LPAYLTSFSVVFNMNKLIGPPVGGWLVVMLGTAATLTLDATSYLLTIFSVLCLLTPRQE